MENSKNQRSLADETVTLDTDRRRRCGYSEVVYGEGKSAETIAAILAAQLEAKETGLVTRLTPEIADALLKRFPRAIHNSVGRTLRVAPEGIEPSAPRGTVAVITAGSTDQPVAEEAAETLLWMGAQIVRVNDVGVAGPHRLPARLAEFESADAVVVVAGMEGALPSIVGGYVRCPVIGVPTSVGYGANFGGLSALLSMLNSCAPNVAVVNIDAGFKAGYMAGMIAARVNPGVTR